jgi:predicted nucleotidyltransferase
VNKQTIINTINAEKHLLQSRFGVEEIALFGSYARNEANHDSDIDILVKLKERSLTNYFNLLDFLEEKLHSKIDLVTKHKDLSDSFVQFINRDIVYV